MWSLVQYSADDGDISLGVLEGGRVHALDGDWPRGTLELIEGWSRWERSLREIVPARLPEVPDARLTVPITYPRKILCAGANYHAATAVMGNAKADTSKAPFFFMKAPSTSLVGPYDPVEVWDLAEVGLDWEVELAVVIRDRCARVAPEQAAGHIVGYAVANDLSARNRFPRPWAVAPPFAHDWVKHKSMDNSCPMGPGITPFWQVPDPQALHLRLSVNGVGKQSASSGGMIYSVAELVSWASHTNTLEPGDVILTGSPEGVGMPTGSYLRDQDLVEAEIEGLGVIRNRIVAIGDGG